MMLAALLASVALLAVAGCGGEAAAPPDPQAVHDRIFADADELAAEGFHLQTASIEDHHVEVGLITARDDHAEYFRERYGPVRTEVIATSPTSLERVELDGYRARGRSLRLFYGSGGGAELERVKVRRRPGRVRVTVIERVPNGPRTLELKLAEAAVRLRRPLGDRAVIDGATGERVRPCSERPCAGG